ncbi:hypothetical protein EDC65_3667 [Stella humosa]|uniref:Yip1-like protein n=1 Tax=Stella humosa TaxID=94 RepID=A0A3N1KYT2_9PROT|nr:hypothetical protein [Stella humosa]ROP84317.1 hypothetical protein EDC65_3667 [Stella humosa]BBK33831.1 hypothetical protein STHU_44650 [Stella humosa]
MHTPSTAEIAHWLDGAWRLACRDPAGMARFDGSLDTFWKSFFAAVLALPFFALLVMLRDLPVEPRGGTGVVLVTEAISYVASWAAFPLAMVYLSAAIGRRDRYLAFIAAFNWSAMIQVTLFLAATGLAALDLLPDGITQGIAFGVTMLVLAYEWFIVRVGLGVGGWIASGVVFLDLALGIVINGLAQSIYS